MGTFKLIVELIQTIVALSILGLIWHFRKELKSLLVTLTNIESLKWGRRGELKIRQQMNKLVNLKKIANSEKTSDFQKVSEENLLLTKEQLLLMSTLALNLCISPKKVAPETVQMVKHIRDEWYNDIISSTHTKSENIIAIDSLIGTSEGFPPIEEPQQSKP